MRNTNLHPIQLTAYSLISFVLILWLLKMAAFIFVPLVWGLFFAFALYPMSNWLEERRFPRSLAIALSIGFVTLIGVSTFYLLFNQVIYLLTDIPEIGALFQQKLTSYLKELERFMGINPLGENDFWKTTEWIKSENLNTMIYNTGKSLTLIGIIPLFIFFLLYFKDFFISFILKASSKKNAAILVWVSDVGRVVHSYLLGMVKVTLFVAFVSGLFFYFSGVKYYLLFSLFIAIMNLIPYIGVIISSVLVVLYVFLTTDTLFHPLLTLLVLWGIQLLENNLITPLVVGSKVKVNVLAVVLAIMVGGGIWGVSGMVLFIPMVGILKITLDRIEGLHPYGYLLGDDVPILQKRKNFLNLIGQKWKKK